MNKVKIISILVFNRYITGIQKRAGAGVEKSFQTPSEVAEVILKVVVAEICIPSHIEQE